MLNRLITVLVLVPVAVVLVAIAVANRGPAAFTLDPFHPGNPGLTIQLPLFALLFIALALGMLIGSFTTWLRQGRYRRMARQKDSEVEQLRKSARNAPSPTTSSARRSEMIGSHDA